MKTLSFADTLHPEVGGENIGDDERQWEQFWQEARGELPIAIAEKVDDDPNNNNTTSSPATTPASNIENGNNTGASSTSEDNDLEQTSSPRFEGCFYIEGLVGCVFAISVGLGVFFTELVGATIYMFAVGFYKLAKHPNTPIFFKALFQLITQIFMVVDSVFLLSSVLISEILGFVVGIVLFVICAFSTKDPYNRSIEWAVYIRTFAHLVRQTFRTFHQGWEPDRKFPLGQANGHNENEGQNQQDTTHANAPSDKDQDSCVACEPTVIETSATFVIEPLDDEVGIESRKAVGDDVLKNRKEGKSGTSPSSSFRSLGSNSTSTSIPPPPPGYTFSSSNSNSHPADTSTTGAPSADAEEEGNVATSAPTSYVMEDDENDMV
mmetsp:Transcript_61454/g.150404  ORF Transcript_61454/g.150404 Transcript_61454/m.150404 type:complete len:379 (+) Transcript_61454:273-1409(+)